MEILPLGTGEAFARTLRQTNFLISPAEGEPFLIDFGHTAVAALREVGVPLRSAARVVVSHLHADHIGGLEELGFTAYFAWRERPTLYVPEVLLPFLWSNALAAGLGQCLPDEHGALFEPDLHTYFRVEPLVSRAPTPLGSVELTAFPTPHAPGRPSFGFLLRDAVTRQSAMLTCDSRLDRDNLEQWGADAACVFHDCQLSGGPAGVHATLDELLLLPSHWQEKILLVHYGDDWRRHGGRIGGLRFAGQGQRYRF
ncbi:MAG: MBL fold metallo-hydrolase [Proteobacteria bacterium]|nr:MBL fold metallo-hydrolase [Pseudomonadota bacterium]